MKLKSMKSSIVNFKRIDFLTMVAGILFIAITASGCAYNNNAINKNLTKTQANKLNGEMFAILNIPLLTTANIIKNIKHKKHKVLYIPKNMLGITEINNKSIAKKLKHSRKLDTLKLNNKKINRADLKQNKPNKIRTALQTVKLKPYTLIEKNNSIYLKINTKKKIIIDKKIISNHLTITIRGFKYLKGYEIVSASLNNYGNTRFINLNFKYSNAGNSFKIKKWETIKNLTVAERYKKGIILWLNF